MTGVRPFSPAEGGIRPHEVLPPLALKLCAGCSRQFAVEGDVGDEQGGVPWFCARCPVPEGYQYAMIRDAARRL